MQETQKTVLLLEPQPDLRSVIHDLLETLGYRILIALNGDQAIQFCLQTTVRLYALVASTSVPGTTASGLVETVRRMQYTVPVILVSSFGMDADLAKLARSGGVGHLPLPFSARDFEHELGELVAPRGLAAID